jgi:uncharacterized protein (DUF1778 family)
MDKTETCQQVPSTPMIPQVLMAEPSCSVRLSERDESAVMAEAERPPEPNEAAVKAARRFIDRHG